MVIVPTGKNRAMENTCNEVGKLSAGTEMTINGAWFSACRLYVGALKNLVSLPCVNADYIL